MGNLLSKQKEAKPLYDGEKLNSIDYMKYSQVPDDIKEFFINNIKEKSIVKSIFDEYLYSRYRVELLKYKMEYQDIDKQTILEKIDRVSNVGLSIVRNNFYLSHLKGMTQGGCKELEKLISNEDNYIGPEIRKQYVTSISNRPDSSDTNSITICRAGDLLSGISFSRYDIGDSFTIKISNIEVFSITLTEENRYNIFKPIRNKHPIPMISIQYNFIQLVGSRTLDKPIRFYYLLLGTKFRKELGVTRFNIGIDGPRHLSIYAGKAYENQ